MGAGAPFLRDLAVVLGVAALTTLACQKLRQPVVLGYLLAGLIIGPHVPVPLVADGQLVRTLSELGVILLMFGIGIEFSIRKLARVGMTAALTAALEVGLMVSLGYLTGQLLGWTGRESLFLGACLGISSTMLVAKAFDEMRLSDPFTEVVFGVLVFEDLLAILLLAILTAVATGHGLSPAEFALTAAKLAAFLAVLLLAGLLVVPRAVRQVARLRRPETLLIATLGMCFGMALLAEEAGYSVALGAFLAGLLVAESGKGKRVEPLLQPFRDLFAAIFFVAVGMTIDPRLIARHALPILVLTVVVLVGKTVGVTVGTFLLGHGLRRSVRAGLSLAQIGEFSFIIAGLGVSSGAVRDFLLPVAVAVSCITALTTPWLIRASARAAVWLDAHLPRRIETFVTFYGSWIEGIRAAPRRDTLWTRIRRSVWLLAADAALLAATGIGASVLLPRATDFLRARGLSAPIARTILIGVATGVAALFLVGVLRRAHRLGQTLAVFVLPVRQGVDLGRAPRRVLMLTLELAIFLVVGLPLVALIQPFVPTGGAVFGAIALVIGFGIWRSLVNLQGHVRAGSELIVEALARQSRAPTAPIVLDDVREMLPGIPGVVAVRLGEDSPAVGRSLGEVDLRAKTGATVLAIHREGGGEVLPSAVVPLRPGDVLTLAGPEEAIRAAKELLGAPASRAESAHG